MTVLIGLIVVLIFPWGPFILKLTPNSPSPTSFGITISPKTGIFEINLLKVLAGTKVPLKLVKAWSWYPSIKTEILGPSASISFNFKISFFFSILISKTLKDIPSPSAKSAKPPKSAKVSNLTIPGAFITLKFSIFKFDFVEFVSIIDVNNNFPPVKPLKKLYSVNSGFVMSE